MWEQIAGKIGLEALRTLFGKVKSAFSGKRVKITSRELEIPVPGGRSIKYSERIIEVPLAKETMTLVDGGVDLILTYPATAGPISKTLAQAGAKELEEPKARKKLKKREDAERLVDTPQIRALPEEVRLRFGIFVFIAYGDGRFHSEAFSEAEIAYRKAYELAHELDDKPLQGICLNLIGAAIANQGKNEAALPMLDEALRLNPDSAEAWFNKGLALGRLRRYEEVIPCIDEAIRIKPDFAVAWFKKGLALCVLELYEEAIPCFDEAIRLTPDYADAWHAKGVVLTLLKRCEEAVTCYDEAIRLEPHDAEAWYHKGLTLSRLERPEQTILCYDEAIRLRPDYADAWCDKGEALSDLERYEEAIPCLDEALKLNHNDGRAWAVRGRALLELDQDKEAKHSFEKALPLRDQRPDKGMLVFSALALLILVDGMESVASKDMKEAEERVSELTQLRKEAEKDDMAQVIDEAIAKFKQGLPKKLLKDFRKFEKMLKEAEEP